MASGEIQGVALRQFHELRVSATHTDQAWPRGLAERQAKFDASDARHQSFVQILNRLDKVRLPEDDIDLIRLVDLHARGMWSLEAPPGEH